jgi:hypothetical protein
MSQFCHKIIWEMSADLKLTPHSHPLYEMSRRVCGNENTILIF